ncbi:Translational activator GCN1-like protein [Leptotrombidium deliense]|uniref:Translational activator GCN1-like protein n=1 Tax=Leptotrombidium deliense TaxID=299467 RepID=A0A443SRX6_9ACAR|nr:Translational activator GCN1-like protein [Leptotrombidium deliense]
MDSSVTSEALRHLPLRIQSSSGRQREAVFADLNKALISKCVEKNSEEATVRGVCRLLTLTLPRYCDRKSRSLVIHFVHDLLNKYECAAKHLVASLFAFASSFKQSYPTASVAKLCMTALNFSVEINHQMFSTLKEDVQSKLLESQAIFITIINGSQSPVVSRKAWNSLSNMWSSSFVIENYLDHLSKISSEDVPLQIFILWGEAVKFCFLSKKSHLINKYKDIVCDILVKHIIGTKTKISIDVFTKGCQHIVKHMSHDDFKQKILPAIQRAVLRNPEVVLELIPYLISSLSFDLSTYALELGKLFGSQLHSKEDAFREVAILGSRKLAEQCSNSNEIESLLKHYFAILNGSEGKLTIVTQRYGVLSGIGALSFHCITGAAGQALSEFACNQLIPLLKSEVHEGTLLHSAQQMQLWCNKLVNNIPLSVIEWFKTVPNLKTSTSITKSAYISCVLSTVRDNTYSTAAELLPIVSASAQKSFGASVSQMPVVTEGLFASTLILKICSYDKQLEGKVKLAMNGIIDVECLPFLSEKFIYSSNEQSLICLCSFIESLCLDHESEISSKIQHVATALLLLCTHPISHTVRKQALNVCKKLILNTFEVDMYTKLLQCFPNVFQEINVKINSERDTMDENLGQDQNKQPSSSSLIECLQTICLTAANNFEDQKEKILLNALPACHISAIFNVMETLWIFFLKKILTVGQMDIFVKNSSAEIVDIIEDVDKTLKSNCIKTLVKYFPNQLMPIFVNKVISSLRNPEFKLVTKTDYEIYKHPEGHLFDKSVIEIYKDDSTSKNIKRESKLYSYKEQMADIELRKEIEAKKREKGEIKEPELNKKQQEAKKIQLEKESSVRMRIAIVNDEFVGAMNLLHALADGNPLVLSFFMCDIVPALINLFSSPLCAEQATHSYLYLRRCVFAYSSDLNVLGDTIAYATLRHLKPLCDIDSEWCAEPLESVVDRVVNTLFRRTCRPMGRDYDEQSANLAKERRLTAAAFAYTFPFLSSVMLSKPDENTLLYCLQIISEHAQIRSQEIEDLDTQVDENTLLKNPLYLPRNQMLEVIFEVIEFVPAHLEQAITNVLLDVVACASGKQGCCEASNEEVNTLLNALKNDSETIRFVSLCGLNILSDVLKSTTDGTLKYSTAQRIWISSFDPSDKCAIKAKEVWENCGLISDSRLCTTLVSDLLDAGNILRESIAGATEALLQEYPKEADNVVLNLMELYQNKCKLPSVSIDSFGRPTNDTQIDTFEPRLGVALVLTKIAPHISANMISDVSHFLVPLALSDRNESVRNQMLEAGIAVVDLNGKKSMGLLLDIFEKYLDEAPDSSANDSVRRSVVILMGTLARHLDKEDPKVKPIVAKLIETLSTPAQIVQEAVANCLPHLIPAFKDEAPTLVQKLLQLLLESDNYGERKGAAYGIAGLVKGLGILSLKQLGIMETLTEAIEDKKNPSHREGALFAFEMLCNMLGRLFEPYIIHILPNLLLCFGDSSPRVRQATDDTAKAVMSKLSAHGVKLVLPSLLDVLEKDSWRTKAGSIELLGAMAFCAPKQLSSCLPNIVPKLMLVLSDSHTKVQKAGAQALRQIGSVIRNPEIQAIVPTLLEALQDPANKTQKCLTTMLNTKFVHFIDAPSLALIMPVIERAFQGRSTEIRKMAAQIIGNMYSLTDQKDLAPYLPSIIPGLKQSLLDPVPEVRAVTARALGAMVKGMGEDVFEDLMPWLMDTLTSESGSVDRSGAAQGLSEVMGGLGLERLDKLMPEIISTSERTDIAPHVKDGYIMLFIYLPMVFTQDFTPYIGKIINPVLKALADENEYVRETALKAGQRIVNMYADTAIQLLLPELELGLFDENWRIRYSSVQLLGDLLYKISGVSGKMTTETASEDDNFGTEHSYRAIINSLGGERRNRVLSGLYMGRSDVSLPVRQAALHVWKIVVTNTPRTLKEILPTLFSLLLGCLASNSYDKQQVAARTLGDLVRKLGERVLPEIIPILEEGLESDRADQRQGVCIGLSEIISSTSRDMVQAFADSLVPTVTKALYDPLPEVRQAAAKTFDSLHSAVGGRALEDILPHLLNQLGDPVNGEFTLDGLRQVMAIKSRVVLPYLVPQLTVPPVNTRALSLLSTVAGESLSKHLSKILPALLLALSNALDKPNEKQELEYCQSVILSVSDDQGARAIVDHLLEAARNESTIVRRSAVLLLYSYCCQTKASLSPHVPQLIRGLILLFTDTNEQVLHLSWEALNSVTKSLDSKEQIEYVNDVRNAVRFACSDLKNTNCTKNELLLPGFCTGLSKGISPILPIFREAILNGNADQKEQAAHGLAEVIKLTSAEALKPSVVNIAGPLIRILCDRYTWNVKVAVLNTLALLLSKVGPLLRPFIPQLQQTFLKALNDSNRTVRLCAANALSCLIVVHTRCDPVFTELHNAVKASGNNDDSSVRETMLFALRMSIIPAGDKMSDAVRSAILSSITSMMGITDDACRQSATACLGSLCKWLNEDELATVVKEHFVDDDVGVDWTLRHGRSVALRIALKETPEKILKVEWIEKIVKTLISYMTSDRVPIVYSGVKATTYFFLKKFLEEDNMPSQLITTFVRCMNHSNNEVKQVVASSVTFLMRSLTHDIPTTFLKSIVPMLVNGTKEKNTMVKVNSEQALVSVLKLRSGEETSQRLIAILDPGAKESLQDCISKVLKRTLSQPEPKEEKFDDTLLLYA